MSTQFFTRLLGYKDFYFDISPKLTKYKYAKSLSKELLFHFCFYWLGLYRTRSIPMADDFLKDMFTFNEFNYQENKDYERLKLRLEYIKSHHPSQTLEFFSIESLLSFYIWVNDEKRIPSKTNSDPNQILPLFKLFLLFNEDVLNKTKKSYRYDRTIPSYKRITEQIIATSFPQFDIEEADYPLIINTQFHKGARLLNYMDGSPKYQALLAKLLTDFKVASIEEYFQALGSAIIPILLASDKGWTKISVPRDSNYVNSCLFLDKLSVYQEMIEDLQDDFLSLRSRPLQKITDGEYMLIFDLFLIKKVYTGLIFQFSAYCNADRQLLKGSFFGNIRDDFSESVLLYETINSIFSDPNAIKVSGKEFKDAGLNISEPDYYVRIGNNIFLFESKDFYIQGTVKLSYDFKQIEKQLTQDKKGKKDRLGKAISQLLNNIVRTFNNQLIVDSKFNPAEINIFPIIIVHDSLYSAPGLNRWAFYNLKDEIQAFTQSPEVKAVKFKNVFPITIVEIDTLLFYEKHFHDNKLFIKDLLVEYHQIVGFETTSFASETEHENHISNTLLSFAKFVRSKAHSLGIPQDMQRVIQNLNQIGIK